MFPRLRWAVPGSGGGARHAEKCRVYRDSLQVHADLGDLHAVVEALRLPRYERTGRRRLHLPSGRVGGREGRGGVTAARLLAPELC